MNRKKNFVKRRANYKKNNTVFLRNKNFLALKKSILANPKKIVLFSCMLLCLVIISLGLGLGLRKKTNNNTFTVAWQNAKNNIRFLGTQKNGLHVGFLPTGSEGKWVYANLIDTNTKNGSFLNKHSNITTINVLNLTTNKSNTNITTGEIYVGTKNSGLIDINISQNSQTHENLIFGTQLNPKIFLHRQITMVTQTTVTLSSSTILGNNQYSDERLVFVGTNNYGLWCGLLTTKLAQLSSNVSNDLETSTSWSWSHFSKLADITKSNTENNGGKPSYWGPELPDNADITAFKIIHKPTITFLGKKSIPSLTGGEFMIGTTHGVFEMVFYNIAEIINLECLKFLGNSAILSKYITSLYTYPTADEIQSYTNSYGFIGTKSGLFEIIGGARAEQNSTAWTVFSPDQYHTASHLITDTANITTINAIIPAKEPKFSYNNVIIDGLFTIGTSSHGLISLIINSKNVRNSSKNVGIKNLKPVPLVMLVPKISETVSKIPSSATSNQINAFFYTTSEKRNALVCTNNGIFSCVQDPATFQWYAKKIWI